MPALTEKLPGLLSLLGHLTTVRDTEVLEQSVLRTISTFLGAPSVWWCKVNPVQPRIVDAWVAKSTPAWLGGVPVIEHHDGGLPTEVAQVVARILADAHTEQVAMMGGVRMGFAVRADDKMLAVLQVYRERPLTALENDVVRSVLLVYSNYHLILDASRRDRLTGLLNRQALEDNFEKVCNSLTRQALQHESAPDERREVPDMHWVAVIDIDHFKRVNDTYGHIIGDEVLLLVAQLMVDTLRGTDQVFRYGGEEFVALLATSNEEGVRTGLERLRQRIEQHVFPQVGRVTISVGFAQILPLALSGTIIGNADRALYHSKSAGRNQVNGFEDLMKAGVFQEIRTGDLELF